MSEITARRKPGRPRKEGEREPSGKLKRASKGKPRLIAKEGERLEVEQMVAIGESQEVIAEAMGCSVVDLVKRYGQELLRGHPRRRREVVGLMFASARAGNATMIQRLADMTAAVGAETSIREEKPKEPKLGKREQLKREAAAAGVGSAWGDDLVLATGGRPN